MFNEANLVQMFKLLIYWFLVANAFRAMSNFANLNITIAQWGNCYFDLAKGCLSFVNDSEKKIFSCDEVISWRHSSIMLEKLDGCLVWLFIREKLI